MRKIVLIISFFLLFITALSGRASAACVNYDVTLTCERCVDTNPAICCDRIDECANVPAADSISSICDYITDPTDNGYCTRCYTQGNVWTALGCLPANPSDLINYLLTFGIGIAGGIAFLLILVGGFQIMTSTGNPEQLNAGKELVGSAVTGLILIIFSVFLLKVIGYDILRIPRFGG
jgi:hypothetical protein